MPFICAVCQTIFTRLDSLKRHCRTVDCGEKRLCCHCAQNCKDCKKPKAEHVYSEVYTDRKEGSTFNGSVTTIYKTSKTNIHGDEKADEGVKVLLNVNIGLKKPTSTETDFNINMDIVLQDGCEQKHSICEHDFPEIDGCCRACCKC